MKKRKLNKGEKGFILILGVFSAVVFALALQMFLENPSLSSQGAFPLFTSGVMLIMFLLMVLEMRGCEGGFQKGEPLWEKGKALAQELFPGRVPLIILYVILYAVLLPVIGFIATTYLFLVGSMISLNQTKIVRSFLVAAGILLLILLIFQYIFKVVLP